MSIYLRAGTVAAVLSAVAAAPPAPVATPAPTAVATPTPTAAPRSKLVTILCDDPREGEEKRNCTAEFDKQDIVRGTAWAEFSPGLNTNSGWGRLDTWTFYSNQKGNERFRASEADEVVRMQTAAFAAGAAEAALSCPEMLQFKHNVISSYGHLHKRALDFIRRNDEWTREKAKELAATDDFWMAISVVLAQVDGLHYGFNQLSPCGADVEYTKEELLLVNLDGDMFDLAAAFPARVGYPRILRCSALFKLAADGSDIFFGHDTWDTYANAAPRVFKHARLPVRRDGIVAVSTVAFSSSPGFVSSVDDYYQIDGRGKLVVIETTLNVYRTEIYKELTPETVLFYLRIVATNMLAKNAPEWKRYFERLHSGTYNNQWMVLDLAQFTPYRTLPPDTFWVVEEMPGLLHGEDQTHVLNEAKYWGSYNVAFYPDIREASGEPHAHGECARAKLFRDLQDQAVDVPSMQRVMGRNDYQHDKFSHDDPTLAIAARDDLASDDSAVAAGAIDSKVSSFLAYKWGMRNATTARALNADAEGASDGDRSSGVRTCARASDAPDMYAFGRVGPTHDEEAVFCWTNKFKDTAHAGHPECFDYKWVAIAPREDRC